MPPYLLTQRVGAHPKLAASGAADPYFAGRSILGRMRPIHSVYAGESEPCLAHVGEWKFSEDEAGVPFDVDNIWTLRTRVLGHDDGGEADFDVAVPKILPEGYTPVGRCGRVPLVYDHLGDDPMQGVVEFDGYEYATRPVRWRTPTGQYPPDLEDNGYLWVPMNLNQQVLTRELNGGLFQSWGTDGSVLLSTPGGTNPVTGLPYSPLSTTFNLGWFCCPLGQHVGFRGGKVRFSYRGGGYGATFQYPWRGYLRVKIGYSYTPLSFDEHPSDVPFDEAVTKTEADYDGTIGAQLNWTPEEWDLPALPAPNTGVRPYWYLMYTQANQGVSTATIHDDGLDGDWPSHFRMSPRTDIPPWFWSSTRNRISPGGIILP